MSRPAPTQPSFEHATNWSCVVGHCSTLSFKAEERVGRIRGFGPDEPEKHAEKGEKGKEEEDQGQEENARSKKAGGRLMGPHASFGDAEPEEGAVAAEGQAQEESSLMLPVGRRSSFSFGAEERVGRIRGIGPDEPGEHAKKGNEKERELEGERKDRVEEQGQEEHEENAELHHRRPSASDGVRDKRTAARKDRGEEQGQEEKESLLAERTVVYNAMKSLTGLLLESLLAESHCGGLPCDEESYRVEEQGQSSLVKPVGRRSSFSFGAEERVGRIRGFGPDEPEEHAKKGEEKKELEGCKEGR
jgi:hypothetical protein